MLINLLIPLILICFFTISYAQIPAFPGAEGFGSTTPGGRGGAVIEVTNLNPDGLGSFREACYSSGPRIIVFRIGGIIQLDRNIYIRNPYLTIAGQTAPGDGICIKGAAVRIVTHDVIIRNLRIRVGDEIIGSNPDNRDGCAIHREDIAQQTPFGIIIDHCSISWAIDENSGIGYDAHDITFSWCIISEGLSNSRHPKGIHSMGMLNSPGSKNLSIHHNLFAHNRDRNPLFGGTNTNHPNVGGATQVELINNIIYNWDWFATRFATNISTNIPQMGNIIGNFYKKGVETRSNKGIWVRASDVLPTTKIYVEDNIGPGRPTGYEDEWAIVEGSTIHQSNVLTFNPSGITTISAVDAFNIVLNYTGALFPYRDPVDTRVVQSVRDSTGIFIDSQDDVGGWPTYIPGTSPLDSDHDGIPDNWEIAHGLNPFDPNDGKDDRNSDGYTNIEEYINGLIPSNVDLAAPKNIRIKR